jgi:acyl-CoA dehydrogenase-like protein
MCGPVVDDSEQAGRPPAALLKEMGSAGLLGLAIGEEDGGGGGDALAMMVLSEELARASGGIAVTALVSGYMSAPHIARFGTADLTGQPSPGGAAIPVASGDPDDLAGPAPGPVRGPAPVLVLGQQVVGIVFQEQLHEHRVHRPALSPSRVGAPVADHPDTLKHRDKAGYRASGNRLKSALQGSLDRFARGS